MTFAVYGFLTAGFVSAYSTVVLLESLNKTAMEKCVDENSVIWFKMNQLAKLSLTI